MKKKIAFYDEQWQQDFIKNEISLSKNSKVEKFGGWKLFEKLGFENWVREIISEIERNELGGWRVAQRRYVKDDHAKGVKRKEMGGGRVRVKLGMLL